MDTTVLDASAHGPAIGQLFVTGRRLTCEAPIVRFWATAGSSETFIAPILQQDKIQGSQYIRQVPCYEF